MKIFIVYGGVTYEGYSNLEAYKSKDVADKRAEEIESMSEKEKEKLDYEAFDSFGVEEITVK